MKTTKMMLVMAAVLVVLAAKGEEKAEKALDFKVPAYGVKSGLTDSALEMKGKYTLMYFWSNKVATSKENYLKMAAVAKFAKSTKIEILPIAFEPLKLAYEGTESATAKSESLYADAYKTFKAKNSLSNYLVDEKGTVVARDVTPEELVYLINKIR